MTAQEAIDKYSEKFGGFPYLLFMGAPDEAIIKAVTRSINTGEKIKPEKEGADY